MRRNNKTSTSSDRPLFYKGADFELEFWQALNTKRKNKLCTLIWIVLALVAFGATGYFTYSLIKNYLEFESYITQKSSRVPNITLPAMTICNLNSINKTQLFLLNSFDIQKQEMFLKLLKVKEEANKEDIAKLDPNTYKEINELKNSFDILNFAEMNFKSQLYTPYTYKYSGKSYLKSASIDSYTHATSLGRCISFNDKQTMVQYKAGVEGGVTVNLDTEIQHYLDTTGTAGYMLFLREPREMLLFDEGGLLLSPGSEHFVRLKNVEVKKKDHPYGRCHKQKSNFTRLTDAPITRTMRECVQDVIIESMVRICGCLPNYFYHYVVDLGLDHKNYTYFDYFNKHKITNRTRRNAVWPTAEPMNYGSDIVFNDVKRLSANETEPPKITSQLPSTLPRETSDFDYYYKNHECGLADQIICEAKVAADLEETAVNATLKQEHRNDSVPLIEDCYDPCEYRRFDADIRSSIFPPSKQYYDFMLKEYTAGYSYETARQNLVRIHIYYDDIISYEEEQTGAYDTSSFIAEFGGTLDLFIGLSFFSILQLLEIILGTLVMCVWRMLGKVRATASTVHLSGNQDRSNSDNTTINNTTEEDERYIENAPHQPETSLTHANPSAFTLGDDIVVDFDTPVQSAVKLDNLGEFANLPNFNKLDSARNSLNNNRTNSKL